MPSVTRKAQATRQERREQIERRLLEATDRLMADGASITELSVDRLASEAGISRASFYIYFEDKGHLLRRLASQVFGDLADAAQRWWSVASRLDPGDVRVAMAAIIAAYRQHQPVLVALNEMAPYDPAVAETYRDLIAEVSTRFEAVIVEGQKAGTIRPQLPPDITAHTLVLMVERTCQQNLPSRPTSFDTELADVLTEIVWGSLYLTNPAG